MDTRLLRTFLAVARTGSFTGAAAELSFVQSTVTSQVKTLEGELGVRLFDRLPGGAQLTEAGRRVAGQAREVLDAQQRLLEAAQAGGAVEGEVVVGATESVCAYRLPPLIAKLAEVHPGVRVHLVPVGTAAALRGLSGPDGRLDLALVLDEQVPAGYDVRPLGREPIEVVAAPAHPATARRHRWRDLAGYAYFLLEEGCSYTDRFVRDLAAATPDRPHLTRFGSVEAARSCVAAGLGLSVLPHIAVAAQLADGTLRRVEAPAQPDVPLNLVTHPRRWSSPAVAAVLSAIGAAAW